MDLSVKMNSRMVVMATILTIASIGQIVQSFLLYNQDGNTTVRDLGWVILWGSAIFGWLPIFTLKKWGGVPKGKQYVNTELLVERGLFAILRHPQYFAGILLGVGLSLVSQNWIVAALGCVIVVVLYLNTFDEESSNIDKFGEPYKQYMQRVPRLNFVLGILRLLRRKFGSP